MLHPAVAHFAISLPIISLILGLLYIMKPSEVMSKISSRFLAFAAVFIVIAYFSGKEDAEEVFEFLSAAGKAQLGEHAKLGLYLAFAVPIVAAIKMYGCFTEKFKVEVFAVVLLIAVSAATIYQGKMGGLITYTHGAHVTDYDKGQACLAEAAEMDDEEEEE